MDHFQLFIDKCRGLEKVNTLAEVEAILVGGSVGRGEATPLSDIDLFLFLGNGSISNFIRTKSQALLSYFGHVLLRKDPSLVDFGYSIYALYEPLFLAQFYLNDRTTLKSDPARGLPGMMIFDRTGYYTHFLESHKGTSIDEHQLFYSAFAAFWFRALSISKDIQRGQLWYAIQHLSDLRDQMFILERLINKCPPPGLHFSVPAKGLENDLGVGTAHVFRESLCEYSIAAVTSSFLFCMEWFQQKARVYILSHSIKCEAELATASRIARVITDDLQQFYR